MDKINLVHPRKKSLAETWSSIRLFFTNFFFVFHFDHFLDLGFETIIDGAQGGSVTVKILSLVKLQWVNSTQTT